MSRKLPQPKKKETKIDLFYKEFDEDMDRLYQEEVSSLIHKKYKRRLKYPESFYDHWKKKLKDLIMYYEAKGYQDALDDLFVEKEQAKNIKRKGGLETHG